MQKDSNSHINRRINVIQVLMVLCIFLLAARSSDIQIFQADELTKKAESDYSHLVKIQGERGRILDRNMNPLAASIEAASVAACPLNIEDATQVAKALSPIVKISEKTIRTKISNDRQFAWIAKKIKKEDAKTIRKMGLAGVYIEKDTKRIYPYLDLAAQIIGFTGAEDTGLEGLEYKYNGILEGKADKVRLKRAGKGGFLAVDRRKRSHLKGKSIVLTIDKKIQYLSEHALEKAVKAHRAKSGIALVMQPKTGELLAMAHYPKFNPNNFRTTSQEIFRNRAVTDPFEPGSVIKVFTAASALEKGYSPRSIFFCENGTYKIGKFTINDSHPYQWLSINKIIKFSSNIGAAKITQTIGDKSLHQYLAAFGFGEKTDVGFSRETSGILLPPERWTKIDASAISFGQGLSVSAVQLLTGISAIANDGQLMKPLLVKKILSNKGKLLQEFHPQHVRQVVSKSTAEHISRMMHLAVQEDGTGSKAAMEGYAVCGKTGTAQKVSKNRKGYSKNRYTSIFAGFAPRYNPELSILVVVDEPMGGKYYGGDVAAPAFKKILAGSFNYLNIPPEQKQHIAAVIDNGVQQ